LEAQQTFTDFTGRIVPNMRVTGPTKNAVKKLKLARTPPELAGNGSEAEAPWRDLFLK
jgi:maleate cis-trans isomerase